MRGPVTKQIDRLIAENIFGLKEGPHKYALGRDLTEWYDPNIFDYDKSFRYSELPRFSEDIASDFIVFDTIRSSWILSKRKEFFDALDSIWQERAHAFGLSRTLSVPYPEVIGFYLVGDYSRAALKAKGINCEA
jgi:hypothetical protein